MVVGRVLQEGRRLDRTELTEADQRKKALKNNNSVLDSRFELQTYVAKTAAPRPAPAGGSKS